MKYISNTSELSGIRIHYIDSINKADTSLIPILICPGLSETAEEYEDLMDYLLPRRSIVLSFRGRGQSDTPKVGYDLKNHILDIASVVKATGLHLFHLFGYSRGVSYALGYARENVERVSSIIVEDYPGEHKEMPNYWPDEYIHQYLMPRKRMRNIREEAVRGIQRDSRHEELSFEYKKPVLVIRGLLEGSLITDDVLKRYKKQFETIEILECLDSGHDIRNTEIEILYRRIKEFLV